MRKGRCLGLPVWCSPVSTQGCSYGPHDCDSIGESPPSTSSASVSRPTIACVVSLDWGSCVARPRRSMVSTSSDEMVIVSLGNMGKRQMFHLES